MNFWEDDAFVARFWAKVDKGKGCWLWNASGVNGRGRIKFRGKLYLAPRVAKALCENRSPPDELLACHRCDNPACCNLDHIWWGTPQDNAQDALKKGRLRFPRPHNRCANGHKLTPENRIGGTGACLKCRRRYMRKYQPEYRAKKRHQHGPVRHRPTPNRRTHNDR